MKSLSIKNYKNLRDLKIDSLSKVNLIVGMNNSGKSTLLEAISIYAANGDISQLKRILELRGLTTRYHSEEDRVEEKELFNFLTLYSGMNAALFEKDPIKIEVQKLNEYSSISIRIVDIAEERITDSEGETSIRRRIIEEPVADLFDVMNIVKGLSVYNNDDLTYMYMFRNIRYRGQYINKKFSCEHILTSNISSKDNPKYYDNIALSELEKELIDALNIIEPNIEAINFLKDTKHSSPIREDNRVPIVVFKGSAQRYRLSTMGDGINRILTIILAMLNCKDGVFLVDEFDNGLHYSVQTKLWKMIYRLAESLNIQVFATTHSDDCIKSFIEADEKGDGKLIRLENRGGDITVVEFNDKERLVFAINNDVEVR